MTLDDLDSLTRHFETALAEAEQAGLSREQVAHTLEDLAKAVREGHTTLPANRGEWWHQARENQERRGTADD